MPKNNNPVRVVLGVFSIFLALVLLIYASGRRLHDPGTGLSQNLSKEFLVQYFVRVHDKLKLDAKLAVPAARLEVGVETPVIFQLRNLGDSVAQFSVNSKINPDNSTNIELDSQSQKVFQLEPGAMLPFTAKLLLKSADLVSRDGTLDVEFNIEAPR